MFAVYKYPLEVADYVSLVLPIGAEPLTAIEQNGQWVLWCLVDTQEKQMYPRHFRIAGTGHPILHDPGNLKYINTFFTHGGTLVWHLFEVLDVLPIG